MTLIPINSPIVTAIIPTKNRPQQVLRAVRSVLNQSFNQLEAVVVIDGPDPATEKALSEIEDARLRVIALSASVGGSDARNMGVANAMGEWVAFLDDDDEWLPTKIEQQLEAARRLSQPSVLVLARCFLRRSEADIFIRPARLPRPNEPICEYMFKTGCGFPTDVFFCSRSLAIAVPFRSGLKKHQDWDWLLRVMAQPGLGIAFLSDPLAVWHDMPDEARISSNSDWQFSLSWARENRNVFTAKGYSLFVARVCLRSAMAQRAGSAAVLHLASILIKEGIPSPSVLFHFATILLVPRSHITRIRHFCLRHFSSSRRIPARS